MGAVHQFPLSNLPLCITSLEAFNQLLFPINDFLNLRLSYSAIIYLSILFSIFCLITNYYLSFLDFTIIIVKSMENVVHQYDKFFVDFVAQGIVFVDIVFFKSHIIICVFASAQCFFETNQNKLYKYHIHNKITILSLKKSHAFWILIQNHLDHLLIHVLLPSLIYT